MKRPLLLLVMIVFLHSQGFTQVVNTTANKEKSDEDRNFRIPLIGEEAPSFTAESTTGTINFPSDYGHKWKILFSHPQDFTPVCSTEILELAHLQNQFEKLGVQIVVVSVGAVSTHIQWKKALEMVKIKEREPVKINFPIVDDQNIAISKEYGMIHPMTNSTKSVRGVFIIDPDNIIQALYFYPMRVGRSTDELLRMITALQTTSKQKVLTPVNWVAGNDVMVPVPPKIDENNPTASNEGYYNPVWFMWFKKASNQ
jgi:peroxiredoxin (alkyl hydroperoxide reductase subunit C)